MSKFLVTGGAGFIGSHIVEALVKRGESVRILDDFSTGKKENLSGLKGKLEVMRGDIRSKVNCAKACRGIDFVLHQAALRSVPKSMNNPKAYNEVNINGTLNMLEAAKENKVKRFVFASSSSVYGDVSKFPENESLSPQPISPYALSKISGEYYCRIFTHHYGLPSIVLRYFNVFGPRQALDDEYAVVVPKFINAIQNNERPPIYGNGRQSRDFTFVFNVVNANLLAAKNNRVNHGVFNIASGKDYSVLDLARMINVILRKNIKPVFLKKRPGDVFRTLADLSNSKKVLNYEPKYSLAQGLKITISASHIKIAKNT
ncbi:MAG: UDP-glucose 4-epimerase [Candidatus Omnitrophica bacterium ADurb.Bin205]|nr:MAG: UDP-glucose 4-epimerase [Candidatus Omnitrophica bacterium ADurb.Bin205]